MAELPDCARGTAFQHVLCEYYLDGAGSHARPTALLLASGLCVCTCGISGTHILVPADALGVHGTQLCLLAAAISHNERSGLAQLAAGADRAGPVQRFRHVSPAPVLF